MNNKEYLVAALRVRNYKGDMLDEPEVVYADLDMATGYPYWSDSYRYTNRFSSIEKAKEFFYSNQKYLIQEDRIDLNTICIKQIQYVEVEKLDARKTKEQMEKEELERKEKAGGKNTIGKYTFNNNDNIEKAIEGLNTFTHNWCMNCKETDEKDDLIFRCSDCEFSTKEDDCLIKKFAHRHSKNLPSDFGAMGSH